MFRKDPFITGEYYHIYNRGVDKRVIFKSKNDYQRFVMLLYIANSAAERPLRLDDILDKQKDKFSEIFSLNKGESLVSIGAWCLMSNHFHILLRQEVDGGITKFMKKLGISYAMFFNIKYNRTGALFGGLFKSKLIGVDDNYMRHLFGYININPLEIRFPNWKDELGKEKIEKSKFLEEYQYSSYPDLIGGGRAEKTILNTNDFPEYFETSCVFKDFIESYFSTDLE